VEKMMSHTRVAVRARGIVFIQVHLAARGDDAALVSVSGDVPAPCPSSKFTQRTLASAQARQIGIVKE